VIPWVTFGVKFKVTLLAVPNFEMTDSLTARKGMLADSTKGFGMWRSLFYAVGIGLFSLGLEGLIFDNVLLHKNSRIQKVVQRVFSDRPNNGNAFGAQQQPNFGNPSQNQNFPFGNQSVASNQSRNLFGGGGARVGQNPQNRAGFGNFSGLGNGNTQLAGYSANNGPQGPAFGGNTAPLQRFVVRHWMPWSLLASGAIIFLYTHSLDKRRSDD